MATELNDKIDLVKTARDNIKHAITLKTGESLSDDIRTYPQKITDIDTTPEGIFIQENIPSKTTQQAVWLKEEDRSNILTTDILLTNLSGSDYTAVSDLLNRLTQEELVELNQYKYISFVYSYMFSSRCWTVYASNTKPVYQNDDPINYRFYYGYVISQESRIDTKKKISPEQSYANYGTPLNSDYVKWILNFDFNLPNSQVYPSSMNDNEQGLYVDINGTRYIINTNKGDSSSSWTKILDTSKANATAGDILLSKTAFINNQKITGTMSNNGTLTYTPTTSQQTIPAGYTSGGTIAAVTSSIDNNITAENIREGITILGVTGTYGGSNKLNIFSQLTEPLEKNGIWFKSNQTYNMIQTLDTISEDVYVDYTIADKPSDLVPNRYVIGGSYKSCNVNGIIHLINADKIHYTYNPISKVWTKLTSTPSDLSYDKGLIIVPVNDDIYIFGSAEYNHKIYKYSTIEDTYTYIGETQGDFSGQGQGYLYNNVIYFIYNHWYNNDCKVGKFDLSTNTWYGNLSITNLGISGPRSGNGCILGDTIYVFTGGNNVKWNLTSNVATKLNSTSEFSSVTYNLCTVCNNVIYTFPPGKEGVYKYDVDNDSFEFIELLSNNYSGCTICTVDNKMYIFPDSASGSGYEIISPIINLQSNSVIIQNGSTYKTKIITGEIINGIYTYFSNAYLVDNNKEIVTNIEKYYGNGTSWVQIT